MNIGLLIIVFIIGVIVGVILMGLVAASGRNNELESVYRKGYVDGITSNKCSEEE